jgi:hypothetical protein
VVRDAVHLPLISACIRIEAPARLLNLRPTKEAVGEAIRGYDVFGEDMVSATGRDRPSGLGFFDWQDANETASHLCLLLSSGLYAKRGLVYEVFVIVEPLGLPEDGRYRRIGAAQITGATTLFDLQATMCIVLE